MRSGGALQQAQNLITWMSLEFKIINYYTKNNLNRILKNWVQNKINKVRTYPLLDKDRILLTSTQSIRWQREMCLQKIYIFLYVSLTRNIRIGKKVWVQKEETET